MKNKNTSVNKFLGVVFLVLIVWVPLVHADDLTSASFIVRDPLVGTGGGYGSSASFAAFGSGDMTSIGRGTSASFDGRYGFLWYPYVTQGTFTATANGSQADLAWGASTAGLGWTVSDYKTGISVNGGSYTYTSRGLVTSYSYTGLVPGSYCFILQTLDAFSNVIAVSSAQCITVTPVLTFSLSANAVQLGALSSSGPRYATTSGGSGSNTVAHTMAASSNAPSGYTITYNGPTLTSGGNTIAPAGTTITNSATGSAGTNQFALSLSSSGAATITTAYNQLTGAGNWKFLASTIDTIATTSGVTSSETYSLRYISNISSTTPAGAYSTNIGYVITGNF